MRAILMISIFLFPFLIFSDLIEIVPRPVNNIVGTDRIVVRGEYDSGSSEIRVSVYQSSNARHYSPIILRTDPKLKGYYVHGVELFNGLNTIKLERKTSSGWTGNIIATKEVTYSSTGPDAEESLWGRIANDGIHKNEEQRSIFYFGGPREVAGSQTVFENEGSIILLPRTRLLNNFNAQNIFLLSANPLLSDFFSKKFFDTRGPSEINTAFDRYEWKTKNDVERIFQEINDANVNIIKLSWWGDFDDSFYGSPDNFDGTTFAPTFPVTCDLILNSSDSVCVKHNKENYQLGTDVRTFCECACNSDSDCLDEENELCELHSCLRKCDSDNDCNTGPGADESCIQFPGRTQKACFNYYTSCRALLYYEKASHCWGESIFNQADYAASGFNTNGRLNDVNDQVFKAAHDKNIFVMPVIELSDIHLFDQEFPVKTEDLEKRIDTVLEKYGAHSSWLKLYNKYGEKRMAIYLIQATVCNYLDQINGYGESLDQIADNAETKYGYKIGFVIDPTVLGMERYYSNCLRPAPANFLTTTPYGLEIAKSLLTINPFGNPFDGSMVKNTSIIPHEVYIDGDNSEANFVELSKSWLSEWKSTGIPMVADVIPGFDDRWRTAFNIFGDNHIWRQSNADISFFYNTAGMSLTTWNGFGEGYVYMPYKKRLFSHDLNYAEGTVPLFFEIDYNDNPVYENEVVYDNYRYAMYLFSAQDSDSDGIPDYFDNCSGIPNPMVIDNSEIVAAPCENGVGGAACLPATRQYVYKGYFGNYWWQPDHDLDGVGDACDPDTIWVDFPGIPVGKPLTKPGLNGAVRTENTESNNTLIVTLDMKSTASEQSEETATTRYCWLTEDEFGQQLWGTEGYCTTEAGHTDGECEKDFGYSHGTDPKPVDDSGSVTWKFIKNRSNAEISDEFTTIPTKTTKEINWRWRYDFTKDKPLELGSTLDYPVLCTTPSIFGLCEDEAVPRFYYTMSTGVHSGTGTYLVNNQINPAFFKNTQKFARSSRLTLDPVPVSYHYTMKITGTETQKYCLGAPCNFPGEWWHDMLLDQLINGPRPYENPGMEHFFKNAYGSDMTRTGMSFREWSANASGNPSVTDKSRPEFLLTMSKNSSGTNTGILAVQNTLMQTMSYNSQTSAGLTFKIAEMDLSSNGNWRVQGVLNNIPENFMPVASTSHKNGLYVVSRENFSSAIINNLYIITQTVPGGNTCTETLNIFVPELIGSLPDISNITIHSFSDGLVAVGEGANGMEVHKLIEQSGDAWFENITGTVMPSTRDVYTVEIKDGVLYLAGGAEVIDNAVDLKTDIWKFTESDGWTLIRNDLNLFPASFRIDFDGTDIVLTNRIVKFDATTERVRFNSDGSGDTPVVEIVPVDGVPAESYGGYCLNETGTLIKGGLEMSGECVPFTHPWYRSFATGSTIYSVAGKGDRLYVGTNNSIKVYDISDPNAFVLKSTFSTGGRIVYDLEVVEGDIMYAATSGGLYKLDTANPDTLSLLSFFATSYNYQYRIQLYNDKLYVGDDNGINIRHKDTFARLAYVNIDSVLDFAIANGEIALYRSSFWSAGLHIRDVETLNLKAYEYAECYTGELTTDHGAFYLSCDGYEYRFEGRPDTYFNFYPLDGDMREMQENHVYNGWTYIPDGSSVKLSTLNDVPSYCGNGVIEEGELCDGNSVACTTISSSYVSGTAYCNSTCNGYNESNCSTDGW